MPLKMETFKRDKKYRTKNPKPPKVVTTIKKIFTVKNTWSMRNFYLVCIQNRTIKITHKISQTISNEVQNGLCSESLFPWSWIKMLICYTYNLQVERKHKLLHQSLARHSKLNVGIVYITKYTKLVMKRKTAKTHENLKIWQMKNWHKSVEAVKEQREKMAAWIKHEKSQAFSSYG